MCEVEVGNKNQSRETSLAKALNSLHLMSVWYQIFINTVFPFPGSISNVTFGAGVSYIGTPATPFLTKGEFWVSSDQDIYCL